MDALRSGSERSPADPALGPSGARTTAHDAAQASPTVELLLREGIGALDAGRSEVAHQYFTRATVQDPDSEQAWFWRAMTAPTIEERRSCLARVLEINHQNVKAAHALKALPRRSAPAEPAGGQHDLFLVVLGGLALVALVGLGDRLPLLAPLRLVLGVLYVLWAPGFCLVAALFPRRADVDGFDRLGLSLGLSVALVPLLALAIDALPWGLRLWPMVASLGAATGCFAAVAWYRRSRVPPAERYAPALTWQPRQWWRTLHPGERWTYRLVGGALGVALLSGAWLLATPTPGERTTEFYMLGREGRAEGFPATVVPDQDLAVTVGIANHEGRTRVYRVEVWVVDGWNPSYRTLVARTGPIVLESEREHRRTVTWRMPRAEEDQQVQLFLFVDGGEEPYRALRLWVDVLPSPSPLPDSG
ncbi:MAG TPA: DUF1616 domain-containing protein [Chloroflexota bacterium]